MPSLYVRPAETGWLCKHNMCNKICLPIGYFVFIFRVWFIANSYIVCIIQQRNKATFGKNMFDAILP